MDINDIRSLVTALGLILFVAICIWAWSRRRRADFDEAARLPFSGDADMPAPSSPKEGR